VEQNEITLAVVVEMVSAPGLEMRIASGAPACWWDKGIASAANFAGWGGDQVLANLFATTTTTSVALAVIVEANSKGDANRLTVRAHATTTIINTECISVITVGDFKARINYTNSGKGK
jgi:hypothetical protein